MVNNKVSKLTEEANRGESGPAAKEGVAKENVQTGQTNDENKNDLQINDLAICNSKYFL